MQHRKTVCTLAAALALAACDSTTPSRPLDGEFVLRTVNGQPVPFAPDTFPVNGSYSVERITGRALEIVDDEYAQYTWAEQLVYYNAPGDSLTSGSCTSVRIPYRVQGSRLILIVDPNLGSPQNPQPLYLDTLQIGDGKLVHQTRSGQGKALTLEYQPGDAPAPCEVVPPLSRSPSSRTSR